MDLLDLMNDKKKIVEGVWHKAGDGEFLIAKWNNVNFATLRRKMLSPLNEDNVSKDQEIKMLIDCMAETVLLDWRGDLTLAGKKLGKYTKDIAKDLLSYHDIRLWVIEHAMNDSKYKAEKLENAEKNL